MKYLFLLLISLNAMASNWMPESKIQAGAVSAHELESECLKSSELCFDVNPDATKAGYVSIVNSEMVLDQSGYDSYLAGKFAQNQLNAGLGLARSFRECGGRVMDMMLVRNQPKGLTISQVGFLLATYAPIQLQLSSGSLMTARHAIQSVAADGVIVTEEDKTALISEINKCLGQ